MTQYHVTLDGQGYVLDLDRYRKRVREPFVPRRGEGSVAVDDLAGPELVLTLSDWSGGEGQTVHDPARPGRYRSGAGIDGFSVPGTLRLGPYAAVVGTTTANGITCLQGFKGKLYAGTIGGGIYSWDGTTFANPHTVAGGPTLWTMATYLGKLYAGNTANGNLLSFDGTTWTDAVATAGGPIYALQTHYREAAQYLYVGVQGAGAGGVGRIVFWDGSALSLGQFDPEEGFPLVMFVLEGRLYIAAADLGTYNWALYSVDDTTGGGKWRRHAAFPGRGFPTSAVVHDGKAYVGDLFGGRVYEWDGAALRLAVDLTSAGAGYPVAVWGPASWRGAVWVGIVDGGTNGLLRFDPATGARSRPVTGIGGTAIRAGAVWQDRLYVGTEQTGASKLWRVDPTLYGGSGQVVSGLIDCGLPGVTKLLRSVTLVVGPLPSGTSVQVEYQLEDAGSWVSLGTLATAGATTATYSFPSNVTCRQVAFRLTLTGVAGTSSSPVVYELALRYVPRPLVAREWELAVVLEGTAELPLVTLDGEPDPLTGAQLTLALWTTAQKAGPVTLVDLDGASYGVYVEDVREEVAEVSQRRGYQRLGLVRLVEAA